MNLPFQFRNQIEGTPGIGGWLSLQFQSLMTAISSTWQTQHNDDGSHGTVTVGSLTGPSISTGTGSPEGVVTAPKGSLYLRTDGSTSTTLYVKTAGTAATGWTAK